MSMCALYMVGCVDVHELHIVGECPTYKYPPAECIIFRSLPNASFITGQEILQIAFSRSSAGLWCPAQAAAAAIYLGSQNDCGACSSEYVIVASVQVSMS
jgi:hypothetical protein